MTPRENSSSSSSSSDRSPLTAARRLAEELERGAATNCQAMAATIRSLIAYTEELEHAYAWRGTIIEMAKSEARGADDAD